MKIKMTNALPFLFTILCLAGCVSEGARKSPVPKSAEPIHVTSSPELSSAPQSIEKVAVYLEGDHRVDPQSLSIIDDAFTQALLAKGYRVASRADLDKVIREMAFPPGKPLSRDLVRKLGHFLTCQGIFVVRPTPRTPTPTRASTGMPAGWNEINREGVYFRVTASVSVKLVTVEEGEVLWAGSANYEDQLKEIPPKEGIYRALTGALTERVPERKR